MIRFRENLLDTGITARHFLRTSPPSAEISSSRAAASSAYAMTSMTLSGDALKAMLGGSPAADETQPLAGQSLVEADETQPLVVEAS